MSWTNSKYLEVVKVLAEKANKPTPPGEQNIFWNATAFAEYRGYLADIAPAIVARVEELEAALERIVEIIANNAKGSYRGVNAGSIAAEAYTEARAALAALPPEGT